MAAQKRPWCIVRSSKYTGNPEDTCVLSIEDADGQTVISTDSGRLRLDCANGDE